MRLAGICAVGLLCACATTLRPTIPELFYRTTLPNASDSACAQLATALMSQANLARDASYEVSLGGSRCHEILYAPDGNEVWLQLRTDELTIAVRNYPQPGDLELPNAGTQSLADSATALVKERYPDAVIQRATEKE